MLCVVAYNRRSMYGVRGRQSLQYMRTPFSARQSLDCSCAHVPPVGTLSIVVDYVDCCRIRCSSRMYFGAKTILRART